MFRKPYGDTPYGNEDAPTLQRRTGGYDGGPTDSLANLLSLKMPQELQLEDLQAIEQALAGDSEFNSPGLSMAYRNKVAGRNASQAGLSSGKYESAPQMSNSSMAGGWKSVPGQAQGVMEKEDPVEKQMRLLALDNAKLSNQSQHKTLNDRTAANLPAVLHALLRRLQP